MQQHKRTADAARKILSEQREKSLQGLDDYIQGIVSEALLSEVFDQAWRFQFEEDRSQVKRAIRQLVADVIEQNQLGVD